LGAEDGVIAQFRYNEAMEIKKTVAQRLIELLDMTADELRRQRMIARGNSGPADDSDTPSWKISEKIRQEIIEAELKSGEISN
jgi:hypothetical protein